MMNQGKNFLIGIFVLSALSILIFILLYLHPSAGDMKQTIHIRFDNIDKINVGTRVNFAGKPVGEVVDIKEIPESRSEHLFQPGEPIYIYELTLKIDSGVKLYTSDTFAIRTSGLLGERSIEITPMPTPKGKPVQPLTSKDIVFAETTGSVEDAFKVIGELAHKVEKTLDYIDGQLAEINHRHLWEYVSDTAKNLRDITHSLNKPKEWEDMLHNVHDFTAKVNKSWDKVDVVIGNFQTVSERIKLGQGTLGRLVSDEDFYLKVSGVIGKANTLMDDINHYGILFHNDKRWQRVRARRVDLLNKLSSPQEFRNFFEDEVNQINTSLARVSMLMEETANQCCPEEIICDREFAKVFADLMRRVKQLEENINLYNHQLVEIMQECDPVDQPIQCILPIECVSN